MECWICGKKGNSGEHLVKASDIKGYFGGVSVKDSVYTHNDFKRNIPIRSIKSKRFKSKALICKHCNNVLTQPYDKAWELLSKYVVHEYPINSSIKRINLGKIFSGSTKRQLINIQLYFVKLFGCRIIENSIPIDTASFSRAILNGLAHDEVYLMFCETPILKMKYAGLSEIQAISHDGIPVWAEWFYTVGHISIKVIYSSNTHMFGRVRKVWHPSCQSKIIKIHKL